MDQKSLIKVKAVELIKDYLGNVTGKLYEDYYDTKDEKIVLISLEELLIEYLGESRTKEILKNKGLKEATV